MLQIFMNVNPEIIGLFAGGLTTIAFIPQVIKVWKTKSTHDISLAMFVMFWIGILLWLVYGIMIGSKAIMIANSLTLILAGSILYFKIKYR